MTLPHRHVPLPRPTPPAPGPSNPSVPCAPTPTSPPGARVPRLQRHPARRPQDTIHQPRRRPNRHPINPNTHQPDRQYGPQKRRLAVPAPRVCTWTETWCMPPSGPTPCERPSQATGLDGGPASQGTPAARPAAAEGSGSTCTLAGHMGSQPRQAPVPDGQTRAATPVVDDAAAPVAPPAQSQHHEPTVDTGAGATEDAEGGPQRNEAPVPSADLNAREPSRAEIASGVTGQPGNHHGSAPASCAPDMAARESREAPHNG